MGQLHETLFFIYLKHQVNLEVERSEQAEIAQEKQLQGMTIIIKNPQRYIPRRINRQIARYLQNSYMIRLIILLLKVQQGSHKKANYIKQTNNKGKDQRELKIYQKISESYSYYKQKCAIVIKRR
ncbi:unnamed protein product (macronuclear) [Paramecium tetraurelia]|uniref:Uncharacterized protein n=1 Tax=Paramecium tetraurelia TaxID=5888 RepID=A0EAA7_PARTE|nr:uncharacterized protein GSPATT00024956001 [Paramecium tetraurelia]CAK92224.1 unnamed protein product [Paramecium tetraurelia]|eukprot:XP_001459621.1 hypothetical protein (macronuclear) [Paramecium tetraurelia strain d4-2]